MWTQDDLISQFNGRLPPGVTWDDMALASLASRSLESYFTDVVWPVVEGQNPITKSWYIGYLCENLQAWYQRQLTRNIIINCQPRVLKSKIASVALPTFAWIHDPRSRWIFISNGESLATEHSTFRRAVLESGFYKKIWGEATAMRHDANRILDFGNVSMGHMRAATVGGSVVGFGGNYHVYDDPLSPTMGESEALRTNSHNWMAGNLFSRFDNPNTSQIALITQRLCLGDTTDWIQDRRDNFTVITLDGLPDATRVYSFPITGRVHTQQAGEPICADRMDMNELRDWSRTYDGADTCDGPRFMAQIRQHPIKSMGKKSIRGMFKFWHDPAFPREDVRYEFPGKPDIICESVPLPTDFDEQCQSWDLSFGATARSDDTCGQVWQRCGANKYLLHQVACRMDFLAQREAIIETTKNFPDCGAIYIEKKANGAAQITSLTDTISGMIPVDPKGTKDDRLDAELPQIRSGNVYLPHPVDNPWVLELIKQLTGESKKDDQKDTFTQALKMMREAESDFFCC